MNFTIDQPFRIAWADPKKVLPGAVLHNRIMLLNLTLMPAWELRLKKADDKLAGQSLMQLFRVRDRMERFRQEVVAHFVEVRDLMRQLHSDRCDVPVAQAKVLTERIGLVIGRINELIAEKERNGSQEPARFRGRNFDY